MDLGLSGKVVMIVEYCAPYARELVHAVQREGASAVLCVEGDLEETFGADAVYRQDLSDPDACAGLRDAILGRFGRLDAVIFHQETAQPGGLLQMDATGFQRRLLPARAAFVCCKVFGACLAGQPQGGAMVLVTTLHDEKPNGSDFTHSVAQGMIGNLVMEAALEYGEAGVRVNQISLGAMQGDAERFPSEFSSLYEGARYKVPAGRLGTPADYAALALFLIGGGSGFLNGARVRMDGGLTLHYVDAKANYRAWKAGEEGR